MKQLTQEKVIEEIKKGKSLSNFPTYKDNKSVVLEAVKKTGLSLGHAYERLKDDKEVVLEAVKQFGHSLQFASERLKDDKDVVLEAVKQNGWYLGYASDRLKKELLPQSLESLCYKGSVDPMAMVEYDGQFLSLLTKKVQNNKRIVLEAIRENVNNLEYTSQEIKDGIGNNDPIQYLE